MRGGLHAWRIAVEIEHKYPISSLIMAAMMRADPENAVALANAFPELYQEVQERYRNPGGYTNGELVDMVEEDVCRSTAK